MDSSERAQAGERLAEDERVDLAGALVGEHRLEIVHMAEHRILERDPRGAEYRAGLSCHLERLAHVVQLGEADLLDCKLRRVLHAAEMECDQEPLLDLEHHVDELLLGKLERSDGTLELRAGLGVFERALVASARRPHRPPHDSETSLIEAAQGALEPRDAGQEGLTRNPAFVEMQLRRHRCTQRQLPLDVSGVKTRRAGGNQEAPYSLIGYRPHDCEAGDRAIGDPHLGPAQHPVGAVLSCVGPHAGGVGAGVRLGQPEAADDLARGHPREPFFFLLLGAVGRDREHRERALDRDEAAEAGIRGLELEAGEAVADRIDAGAAVTLQVHAEEAELAELGCDLARELGALEPLLDSGKQAVDGEAPNGLLEHALLLGEKCTQAEKVEGIYSGPAHRRVGSLAGDRAVSTVFME